MWTIKGKTSTLRITSAEDERLKKHYPGLQQDELSLKSDRDEISTFRRTLAL